MEKWHVTIKENKTGKIALEVDTNAIIGAIDGEGGRTISLLLTNGAIDLAIRTRIGVKKVLERMAEKEPVLDLLETLYDTKEVDMDGKDKGGGTKE